MRSSSCVPLLRGCDALVPGNCGRQRGRRMPHRAQLLLRRHNLSLLGEELLVQLCDRALQEGDGGVSAGGPQLGHQLADLNKQIGPIYVRII